MGTTLLTVRRRRFDVGQLLYALTVAFPSWAGALLLLYSVVSFCLYALSAYFGR